MIVQWKIISYYITNEKEFALNFYSKPYATGFTQLPQIKRNDNNNITTFTISKFIFRPFNNVPDNQFQLLGLKLGNFLSISTRSTESTLGTIPEHSEQNQFRKV